MPYTLIHVLGGKAAESERMFLLLFFFFLQLQYITIQNFGLGYAVTLSTCFSLWERSAMALDCVFRSLWACWISSLALSSWFCSSDLMVVSLFSVFTLFFSSFPRFLLFSSMVWFCSITLILLHQKKQKLSIYKHRYSTQFTQSIF